jgi:hypothetical protein
MAMIVISAVLAVGLALVIRGTLVKNSWGINFANVSCRLLPQVRVLNPEQRQAMAARVGTNVRPINRSLSV